MPTPVNVNVYDLDGNLMGERLIEPRGIRVPEVLVLRGPAQFRFFLRLGAHTYRETLGRIVEEETIRPIRFESKDENDPQPD